MKDSRRGLEILNEVPHADEVGWMTQAPPAVGRPSNVTTLDSFNMQGTKLPLEKLTGETRQNSLLPAKVSFSSNFLSRLASAR